MQGWVHAEGGLGGAGSRSRVRSLAALLGGLLESVEVGNVDAIGGGSLGGLNGALDISGSIAWSHGHVGRGGTTLSTLGRGTAGLPLALLPRRTRNAGEVRLLSGHWLTHDGCLMCAWGAAGWGRHSGEPRAR